jgi:hypothetical protein
MRWPFGRSCLLARDMHWPNRFRDAPSIYPTLLESFGYTVVLACFKIAEDFLIGRIYGRSFQKSTPLILAAGPGREF